MIDSVATLVNQLRQHRLLPAQQLTQVADELQPHFSEPRGLARELINRGWMTPYQINQLFQGHGGNLVLGQYLLLERLGEGAMGQIFKARHQRLDRVVALKVIRAEHLNNPEAVGRFHREIQAVAQLSHPNIVMAFDADQAGPIHFFAMEYVEGTDMARLLKQLGPLPAALAVDYLRQAALGLQHAFERGLVHRDIKPANLLLTRAKGPGKPTPAADGAWQPKFTAWPGAGAVIKLLDMGLARLRHSPLANEGEGGLTQVGKVVGTPDFMAPEQAVNAHSADIRADLYSLGCTFYYLLSGRVPFPGGTPIERIIKHRLEEARPIQQFRPDVPPGLAAILENLMAKDPADRYQTPQELVEELDILSGPLSTAPPRPPRVVAPPKSSSGRMPAVGPADLVFSNGGPSAAPTRPQKSPTPILVGLIALLALGLLLLLWAWLSAQRAKGQAGTPTPANPERAVHGGASQKDQSVQPARPLGTAKAESTLHLVRALPR